MKNLFFFIALFFTITVSAQTNMNIHSDEVKDKRYSIKIQPLSLLSNHLKVGFDYALDEKNAIEFQVGTTYRNEDFNANYGTAHIQMRYKRFISDSGRNLSGFYIAPGLDLGRFYGLRSQNEYGYSILFTDMGLQFGYKVFNFETFGGLGLQTGHDTGEAAAGCAGCGIGFSPNAMNLGPLAIRLGMRIGFQF